MNRRHAIKMITGAFVGQLLLGDGTALSAESAGRHWVRTTETVSWQPLPDYPNLVKALYAERSGDPPGVWFRVLCRVPRGATEKQKEFEIEQGRFTLDTFLFPECDCKPFHFCSFHDGWVNA